jgi:SulP family sulfate permease
MFKPKIFTTLKNYSRKQFASDLIAGIIVGIVALPLAIAFAIASGVTPEKGIFTAIIAGFIISAFGGSRVQIGGPTGAFIVIVYGIVQTYGVDGLTIATLIAGIMLVILGLARAGAIIKFIPHPLIVGFTSGIALIIFSSQMKDLFGLRMGNVPSEFIDKWKAYAEYFSSINIYAFLIAISTTALVLFSPKITRKIPGSLFAILISTIIVYYFKLPVETIGSKFGSIPSSLPSPGLPHIDFETIQNLIRPAFAIALLGGIESLLSAVVADGMIGGNHKSNIELVAQGGANIAVSIFGGIPATGAIARTATNVKNGGRTPVAGIVHALTLLVIMLFVGKWVTFIPMACLAGILIVVAYHMSEWKSFLSVTRGPKSDAIVLLSTFILTVMVDLIVAIEIGMVLAAFLFMRNMTQASKVEILSGLDPQKEGKDNDADKYKVPQGVDVFEISGPLFFGAAYKFKESMKLLEKRPEVLILRMRHVSIIDETGLYTLSQVINETIKPKSSFRAFSLW